MQQTWDHLLVGSTVGVYPKPPPATPTDWRLHRPGSPNGVRTRVSTLRGWCPGPLDDGTLRPTCDFSRQRSVVNQDWQLLATSCCGRLMYTDRLHRQSRASSRGTRKPFQGRRQHKGK